MQGVDLTAQHGLVVVDVNLGVGDLFEAWLQVREESSFSTVFVGLTDDASVRDYFFKSQTDKLVTLHLEKKFNIPGSPPMDLEPPSSRVLQQPSLPQLNVLVAKGLVPTIPEQLDKDWGNRPTFGKEWSKLLVLPRQRKEQQFHRFRRSAELEMLKMAPQCARLL